MEANSYLNYYDVLQCDRAAPVEEIRKNYQHLVLSFHPDKSNKHDDKFHLIQKAWSVLRDAESRRLYDATLMCHEHSDYLLYDTILLSDMVYNEAENIYTYNCRCGGVYLLDTSELVCNKIVIGCDECSFSIQINR